MSERVRDRPRFRGRRGLENVTLPGLIACVGRRWSPEIGDPSLMGWLTVVAYLVTAALAVAVARRRVGAAGFWWLLSVLMAALAVNKQLDLQSALTATGRCIAKAQGWYSGRKAVQAEFIVLLGICGIAGLIGGAALLRGRLRANIIALVGLVAVVTFVLVRAVGFHHVDVLIGLTIRDVRVNWILEWSGLVLIALNAVILLARRRARR